MPFNYGYNSSLLLGISNLRYGEIIATDFDMKILLSSKEWLPMNCQLFFYTGVKLTFPQTFL